MLSGLSLTPSVAFTGAGARAPSPTEALQSSFPGLVVLGGTQPGQSPGAAPAETARPAAPASSLAQFSLAPFSLASGATLLAAQEQGGQPQGSQPQGGGGSSGVAGELTDEQQQVAKLKQIDAKVRAHERAHAAVGGQYAGAPSYTYTRGPDGQMYATGGEVAIDIGPENDPNATLQKAAQVAAAALAPADPSGQDRAVAAAAAQLRLQALAQLREEKRAEAEQRDAERAADKAARNEAQAANPAAGGDAPGQVAATASGGSQPAQARIATASRRIGQLVGLIA
jgi:hypothetical protein